MLRLIQPGKALPTSYIVHCTNQFEPGQIGTIIGRTIKGEDICGLCRGYRPIGIIDDIKNGTDDSTFSSQRITIWNEAIILETNMFEHNVSYNIGDSLGVSSKGLLSPRLKDIAVSGIVAKMLAWYSNPLNSRCFLRFEWIPQYQKWLL